MSGFDKLDDIFNEFNRKIDEIKQDRECPNPNCRDGVVFRDRGDYSEAAPCKVCRKAMLK